MRKFQISEWQILRTGKSVDFAIIAGITLLFLSVIAMNVNLLFKMTSNQTEEIGQMQLENIRSEFESKIANSENITLQIATEAENMFATGSSQADFENFFVQKKKEQVAVSNGVCFNVYIANNDFTIIPDFDMPDNYHAVERLWYKGASENPDAIYITEPYIDASGHGMCFTMSKMLKDKKTVIALDFTFEDMQESISRMDTDSSRTALIATKTGMIIGYSDMSLVGEKISKKLPEYENILEQVVQSNSHESFSTEIAGKSSTIFSSETNNGWYMILSVEDWTLYKYSYGQIFLTIIVSLLMIMVIVIFYLNGVKNRLKAEKALAVKEEFLSHLSKDLREPLKKILHLSHVENLDSTESPAEIAAQVRESALQLSDMLDNLFSFSTIVSNESEQIAAEKQSQEFGLSKVSRKVRKGVATVLFTAMFLSMVLSISTTINWGNTKMNREVDNYDYQLSTWLSKEIGILEMFANIISERPELMSDYDYAVKFLNDIAKKYPEISVCYLANPYNEHSVIMNNGWEPTDPNWRVEQRQWYLDTERSPEGFNVSDPYRDSQTGMYCITISKIVYGKDGEFLGIFAIDFFIDKLISILGESYGKDTYAFLVDKNGIIINHPNVAYQLTAERMYEITGTEYKDAYYYPDRVTTIKDFRDHYVACISKQNAASNFTIVVVNSWWDIYGNAVTLGIIFVLLLISCISAIVALINSLIKWQESVNKKLQSAADEAITASQAKFMFFAQMNHEIRTPLNAVLGMNELILRESDNKYISEYAENIQSAGNTLLTLINSILDFSKLEEGKMKIVPVRYDIALLIDDLQNIVSERANKKGLKFFIEVNPELPRNLYGDDVRIRQIITNILTNAVKYTHEGFIKLFIDFELLDGDSLNLKIKVTDTGIGIRQEDIGKLFKSFQRLDEEKNRNIEGTGLGISIVQKLLLMMDSELKVESVYGEGSTFYFDLRQKIIDHVPIGDYKNYLSEKVHFDKNKKFLQAPNAKILVVDDNKMNLKVIRGMLKFNGIVPDLAESGKACLQMAAEKNYHIIFLDHMMPEMDGVETLKRLKANSSALQGTTIIALTANAISGAQEFYIGEGFDDYLSKPIDTNKLEMLLQKYLPEELTNPDAPTETVQPVEEEMTEENLEDDDALTAKDRAQLKEFCPEINIDAAMSYCMNSKDFFVEMLQDFYTDDKTEMLNELFASADFANYKIQAHALKSTSQLIGALTFSDNAKAQEFAAKDERFDDLRENHAAFMEHYKKVREQIGKWLEVSGNAKDIDS